MIAFIANVDMSVLESLYAIRDSDVVQILIRVTELGGTTFVVGFAACIALYLLLRYRLPQIIALALTMASTAGVVYSLKHLVQRARPDVFYRAYPESGYSFASGHAAHAAALYGFCMFLVWSSSLPRLWRIGAVVSLGLLIATIAFTRIYLGVHYLSDIFVGLLIGFTFAWFGDRVATRLEAWAKDGGVVARALFRR